MTRQPGSPAADDRESPGGRAAERRREHLAARYGQDEVAPDEDAGPDDEAERDEPESDEEGESESDPSADRP